MTSNDERQSVSDREPFDPSEVTSDFRVRAALVRTAMSSEQSLLSWIRTSVSLYTFGFAITQFFYYLAVQQEATQLAAGPRVVGLALIITGILGILLGSIEHFVRIRTLQGQGLPKSLGGLLPLGSAAIFLVVGVIAVTTISLNWHL